MMVWEEVKESSKVLDVGCATGYMARELIKKNCKVWGIEQNMEAAEEARKYCEDIFLVDLDSLHPRGIHSATPGVFLKSLPFKKNFFDYILVLDVIEHLKEPLSVLGMLKLHLRKESRIIPSPQGSTPQTPGVSLSPGKIIISTPNIAHISVRLNLFFGRFDYEKMGIMDETHIRFFTKKTLLELINKAGLVLEKLSFTADFGQLPLIGRIARKMPKILQYQLTKILPNLLAVQFIAVCTNSFTIGGPTIRDRAPAVTIPDRLFYET